MKKKILLSLLCAILCLEVFPIKTIHADENGVAQSNDNVASVTWGGTEHFYNDKGDAWSAANSHNGTIKLLKDWYTTSQLVVSGDVTLDLFDHKIDVQRNDRLIYIKGGFVSKLFGGARLTIVDSGPNKTGSLENGFRQSGAVGGSGIHVLGTLIFKGGTIRNCVNEGGYDGQGTIYIDRATFMLDNPGYVAMYDGAAIGDCKAEDSGGAVYLDENARFYMYGGLISNCSAYGKCATGGAVYAFSGSTFEMSGGTITDCYAPTKNTDYGNGGGVYAYSGSTFKMSGGTIKNCFANRGGGVYLRRGCYTIDNGVEIGSDGILSGGSIIKNRAYINGGGVFVERGKTGFGAVATATLTIKGDISVQDNHGKDKQDGPCRDDVFLDISDDTTDGFRPYLFVKGNLTNKVYVLSNQGGRFSMTTEFGDQSSHIISDDNGYNVILHSDNRYYFDVSKASIYDAYLVTYDNDRLNASVVIDDANKKITIQANRRIDLETAFGFEKVELHWRGDYLRDYDDIETRRVYYDSPFTTTIFFPLQKEKCYEGHYGVYDKSAAGDAVWEVRVYGTNSGEDVIFASKDTYAYKNENGVWEKMEPKEITSSGAHRYAVKTDIPIKVIPIEYDDKEFYMWRYNQARLLSQSDKTVPGLFVIPGGYGIWTGKAWPYYIEAEPKYEIKVENGYFNNDPTCTSIKVKKGTAVDVTFVNDKPDLYTFGGWTTTGKYQIPDELVNNEHIIISSPAESFTIIGTKEEIKRYKVNYYKALGTTVTKISTTEYLPDALVTLTSDTIDGYYFNDFTLSDRKLKTERVGNTIKFLMPEKDIDVYAIYTTAAKTYRLVQDSTTTPGQREYIPGSIIENITRIEAFEGFEFTGFELYKFDGTKITDQTTISAIVTGNLTDDRITVTMPSFDLRVSATYKAVEHELKQIHTVDEGISLHTLNDTIYLKAKSIDGKIFNGWAYRYKNGTPIEDPKNYLHIKSIEYDDSQISILMPPTDIEIEAQYRDIPTEYNLSQYNTVDEGSRKYPVGEEISLQALHITDKNFCGWSFQRLVRSNFEEIKGQELIDFVNRYVVEKDISADHFTLKMPSMYLIVTATYDKSIIIRSKLTQIKTVNEGTREYGLNVLVDIKAQTIEGSEFVNFNIYKNGRLISGSELEEFVSQKVIGNLEDGYFTLKMPIYDLTVEAIYKVIPVEVEHDLTQVNTTSEGTTKHKEYEQISITAKAPESGKVIDDFNFYKNGSELITGADLIKFKQLNVIGDTTSGSFTLVMPDYDLKVEAIYKDIPATTYDLIQVKTLCEGTTKRTENEEVYIEAQKILNKKFKEFVFYKGEVKIDETELTTFISEHVQGDLSTGKFTLKMPNYHLKVEATYDDFVPTKYKLTQIETTTPGTEEYIKDTRINIKANDYLGSEFKEWIISVNGEKLSGDALDNFIANQVLEQSLSSDKFTLIMPEADVTVEATFKPAVESFTLTQIKTVNDGEFNYYPGTNVLIKADTIKGYKFKGWKITVDGTVLTGPELVNFIEKNVKEKSISGNQFTLIMPSANVIVEALFDEDPVEVFYDLIQINTNNPGTTEREAGETININAVRVGATFNGFDLYNNGVLIEGDALETFKEECVISGDLSSPEFKLKMPKFNLTIVAKFGTDPSLLPNLLTQIRTVDEGSKYYFAGSKVPITARAQFGSSFKSWKFYDSNDNELNYDEMSSYIDGDINEDHFKLTMPHFDLKVEATFQNEDPDINPHTLYQINTLDEGEKSYFPGAKIPIQAKAGDFKEWKFYDEIGGEIPKGEIEVYSGDINTNHFTLVMPNHNLVVVALFNDEPIVKQYKLTQIKTINEGTSEHYENDYVYVEAIKVSQGTFVKFKYSDENGEITGSALDTFKSKYVLQEQGDNVLLKMPKYNLTIEAMFEGEKTPHKLICVNTINEGTTYHYGGEPSIVIEALTFLGGINDGFDFYKIIDGEEVKTSDVYYTKDTTYPNKKITLTVMPDFDLKVVAKFKAENEYKLTASFTDEGIGRIVTLHNSGDSITLKPATLLGSTFMKWEAYKTGNEEVRFDAVDGNTNSEITFNMPAYDLTVRAIFTDTTPYYSTEVIHGDVNGESISISREGIHLVVKASVNLGASFKTWKAYKYVPDVTTGAKSSANTMYKKVELTEAERIEYGIPSLTNSTLKFDQPNADLEFEATYEIDKCRLTVINGTISDGSTSKTFDLGDTVYINANTSNGYHFSHWEVVEGNPIWPADGKTYKYTHVILRGDATVRAVFEEYKIPPTSVK